ncbi:hypothetical protein AV540_15525 [Brevibacillus parabrevis]|uniref:SMI1/KNR4 family protein n=1 Tax=Brevibacillus parabrevis TaxID=54914 RepID=UPI0007AB2FD1|nr:SMI1/KNR4 family protein [Brevibacillus parabrevis]KZE48990.1 hypothetical protein AV540_15525 [Brevibacillus parabrevis]
MNQVNSPWKNWITRWQNMLDAVTKMGGAADDLTIEPPATLQQVEEIEHGLGIHLPISFRNTVLDFSAKIKFSWSLPEDDKLTIPLPSEFSGIFRGNCSWNLNNMIELNCDKDGWVKAVFPNRDDPYDKVWHNKLAFQEVGNGDYLAFDLANGPDCPVVYLSHDDGEGHGYILGNNFIDFMERWTSIGCPGAEDWQMLPFITSPTSGIESDGGDAFKWREWLNQVSNNSTN